MLSARTRDSLTLGPWRRRRRMARLLADLDRIDLGRARIPRQRGDVVRRVMAALVALALVGTVGLLVAHKQFGITLTAHGLHRAKPLGTPPRVPTGVGSFRYVRTQPGSDQPVAYDPCKPIEYVVNGALAPTGADSLLRQALRQVSAATGLVFVAKGSTDRLPHENRFALSPARRPVLIAWTTPEVVPGLRGAVAGLGGSTAVPVDSTRFREYVTGEIALDTPQLRQVLSRSNGAPEVRAIIMHELGHVVGLAHVDDPHELMYRENVGQRTFGPGDREGLAALGSGHCFG